MCNEAQIPSQYLDLQFYATLSQYMLQKHKNPTTITKSLRNQLQMGCPPTKITITLDGSMHMVDSLEKGLSLS